MQKQLMSAEEIHAFGIEVVCKYLQKDGHEIIEINTTPGINPQIVARKDEGLEFIVVRTACYPDKGQIESEQLALQCIAHADRHHAICYFASVGASLTRRGRQSRRWPFQLRARASTSHTRGWSF